MKNFYIKKTTVLIFSVFVIIVLSKAVMAKIFDNERQEITFICQGLLKVIFLILTLYFLRKENFFNWSFAFKNNILCFSISVLLLLLSISHTRNVIITQNMNISNYLHYSYFFQCMATGFFEEFFFRFLIFGLVCRSFIYSQENRCYKQVLITSSLFAFAHLSNMFNDDYDLIGVLIQIIFAFLMGVLFQSIFYRLNNIFLVSIIHGLVNYNGTLNSRLFKIESAAQETNRLDDLSQSLITFCIFGILIVLPIFYFSLRNRKNHLIYPANT